MKELFALGSVVLLGVIVADVLAHPTGTAAAGTSIIGVMQTALTSMLGTVPSGYKNVAGG